MSKNPAREARRGDSKAFDWRKQQKQTESNLFCPISRIPLLEILTRYKGIQANPLREARQDFLDLCIGNTNKIQRNLN